MATRMMRAGLVAGVSATCAVGGILALGASASAAPAARTATVVLDCTWQAATGGSPYGSKFSASPELTLSVGEAAARIGAKADLKATAKDGRLLVIPAGAKAHNLAYTGATVTADVEGGSGANASATLTTSGDGAAVGADGVVPVGALDGQFDLPAAGSFTAVLKSVKLTFLDKGDGDKALTLNCAPVSTAGRWPTVTASSGSTPPTGKQTLQQSVVASGNGTGTPTSARPTTATPTATATPTTAAPTTTSPGSTGGLAPTGSGGSKVLAFALVAGSLLLGSLAVILALPNRRRSRPLT